MVKKKEVKMIEEKKEDVKVEAPKKKCAWPKWLSPAIVILIIVASLLGIMHFTGTSKAVAKRAVNRVYNEIDGDLNELERLYKKFDLSKPFKVSYSMKIDADIEELDDEISGLEVSGSLGFDADQKVLLLEGGIENKKSLDVAMAISGKKAYVKVLDEVIDVTEESEIDTRFFKEFVDAVEESDPDFKSAHQVLKSVRDAIIKGISEDALERSTDTITLNGNEMKVNKVTYTLDKKSAKYFIRTYAKTLKADKKFLKAAEKLCEEYELECDADDLKDELDELIEEADELDIDKDEKVVINLYSKGLFNEVIGFSIKADKQEIMRYYSYKGNREFVMNADGDKLVVTGTKKGKKTEYVVKVNKEKIATLTVRSWTDEKVDFDYVLYDDDEEMSGTVYITAKEGKKDFSGEYKFSIEVEDESIELSGDYSIEFDAEIEMFSTKKAKYIEDVDGGELKEKVLNKVDGDELLTELVEGFIEGFTSRPVYNYDYDYDYDYNDYYKYYNVE